MALAQRRKRCASLAFAGSLRREARAGGRFRRLAPVGDNAFLCGGSGYDPELLFVECGRCGAPVLWESGLATRLLDMASIDARELDASCLLMTNGCAMCGGPQKSGETGNAGETTEMNTDPEPSYEVKIFRLGSDGSGFGLPRPGHA